MKSIADRMRQEDLESLRALSATERVRLALALGRRDLGIFRRTQRSWLPREAAARRLDRQRQAGRRRSRCIEALIE